MMTGLERLAWSDFPYPNVGFMYTRMPVRMQQASFVPKLQSNQIAERPITEYRHAYIIPLVKLSYSNLMPMHLHTVQPRSRPFPGGSRKRPRNDTLQRSADMVTLCSSIRLYKIRVISYIMQSVLSRVYIPKCHWLSTPSNSKLTLSSTSFHTGPDCFVPSLQGGS